MKLALVLSIFLTFTSSGCATIGMALPTILMAIQDGSLVLETIDSFVRTYFASKTDDERYIKIEKAIARSREALDAALRITQGADKLDQQKVDEAFADFKIAYNDLVALTAPLGVRTGAGGLLKASPGGLNVPEPLALKIRIK